MRVEIAVATGDLGRDQRVVDRGRCRARQVEGDRRSPNGVVGGRRTDEPGPVVGDQHLDKRSRDLGLMGRKGVEE